MIWVYFFEGCDQVQSTFWDNPTFIFWTSEKINPPKRLELLSEKIFRLERNIHYWFNLFCFLVKLWNKSWMGSCSEHLCCITGTSKGQKILKQKYFVFNSTKNRMKYLPNSALANRADFFLFFLEEQRSLFLKFSDLYPALNFRHSLSWQLFTLPLL